MISEIIMNNYKLSSLWLQGGKNEIFVDVIERLSVVIGSKVSTTQRTWFEIKLLIAYIFYMLFLF